MTLVIISLAFILGVYLLPVAGLLPVTGAAAALLIILAPFIRRHRYVVAAAFFVIAFATGAVRAEFAKPYEQTSQISEYNNTGGQTIRGIIYREPEVSGKTLRLYVSVTERHDGWGWNELSGNILVFLPEYADYKYGDWVEIDGEVETPVAFQDFDYRAYLAEKNIYSTALYPKIRIIDRGRGEGWRAAIYDLKSRIATALSSAIPEPHAALARGILLGDRSAVPRDLKDAFAASGTTHVLAISGANLSIVAAMLAGVFIRLFGKRGGLYVFLTLAVIWGYAVLTGFEPPVARAAVMASIFLFAELLGRQKTALPALALAAALMAFADPSVISDVSFQLSFAAMAGLILLYPPIEIAGRRLVQRVFGNEGIASGIAVLLTDSTVMGLSASLFVLPLAAYYFGTVSLAGLPATVLVLPLLPVTIFTAAATGVAGLFFAPLAQLCGYLAWAPLSYLILVVRTAANVPYAAVAVPEFHPGVVIAFYTTLLFLLGLAQRGLRQARDDVAKINDFLINSRLRFVLVPAALAVILAVGVTASRPDGRLHVYYFDVGQGDAVLVQRGAYQVLVDGGPSGGVILNALGKAMPFWDRDIELVVLTHPDADHVTGLIEVAKRYNVKNVLMADGDFTSQAGQAWLDIIQEREIEQYNAIAGQRITFESVTIDVIIPETPPDDESVDAKSLVLRVSELNFSFLLTADITSATELELRLERADIECSVLKVAHHGSAHGTSASFLTAASPAAAVISVGKDNPFGHPAPEVIERLKTAVGEKDFYRTDEDGTVEFISDGEKLWVKKEK